MTMVELKRLNHLPFHLLENTHTCLPVPVSYMQSHLDSLQLLFFSFFCLVCKWKRNRSACVAFHISSPSHSHWSTIRSASVDILIFYSFYYKCFFSLNVYFLHRHLLCFIFLCFCVPSFVSPFPFAFPSFNFFSFGIIFAFVPLLLLPFFLCSSRFTFQANLNRRVCHVIPKLCCGRLSPHNPS